MSRPGGARAFPIVPAIGIWQLPWNSLVREFHLDPIRAAIGIEERLEALSLSGRALAERDAAAYAFVLSLLSDVIHAGALPAVVDSKLWVSWPDWKDPGARQRLTKALVRLKESEASYIPPIDRNGAADFISRLEAVELLTISDPESPTARLFRAGLTTWSMPYRGREGRMRRSVLVGHAGRQSHPLGILEVGDDAPHNTARDLLCGFLIDRPQDREGLSTAHGGTTFLEWIAASGDVSATCDAVADRLAALRAVLLPVEGIDPAAPLQAHLDRLGDLEAMSRGREGDIAQLDSNKRLAYLARLVLGEASMRRRDLTGRGPRAAVRVLHDLTVPRIQLEATVCGALPPFGPLLAGKLVASMLAHPSVRHVASGQVGAITRRLFDPSIEQLLPNQGAVLITTKGLYTGHSAQYNNVRLPGEHENVDLRHSGNTAGTTTSLLSDRTADFAENLLRVAGGQQVSKEYGSGGGKRQRTIESAAVAVGLHEKIVHPALPRPVYAAQLVCNLPDVSLVNARPDWLIDEHASGATYESRALAMWKDRWLPVALRRNSLP